MNPGTDEGATPAKVSDSTGNPMSAYMPCLRAPAPHPVSGASPAASRGCRFARTPPRRCYRWTARTPGHPRLVESFRLQKYLRNHVYDRFLPPSVDSQEYLLTTAEGSTDGLDRLDPTPL